MTPKQQALIAAIDAEQKKWPPGASQHILLNTLRAISVRGYDVEGADENLLTAVLYGWAVRQEITTDTERLATMLIEAFKIPKYELPN